MKSCEGMSERGEWFVCLVREGAVRALYKQAVESNASLVYIKNKPWRPGVEKCVVRWDHPVTVQCIIVRTVSAMI